MEKNWGYTPSATLNLTEEDSVDRIVKEALELNFP